METTRLSYLKLTLDSVRPALAMHPHTGRLWLDVVYLLIAGACHHTVLSSLTGSLFVVDLMTPWIVALLVMESLWRGAFLGAIAAIILETHSSAPAGLYLCAYWVIAVAIWLTRSTLSWRHTFPWIVTLTTAVLWIAAFESLVLAISAGGALLSWAYVGQQILRVVVAVALGMLISRPLRNKALEEEPV